MSGARGTVATGMVCVALTCGTASGAAAAYPLAFAKVSGDGRPELLLAQRTIERDWGASEDSVYVEIDIPEWRSEGLATAFSAVVPGAGQYYAGERRWWWYALAEVTGWVTRAGYRKRGFSLQNDAAAYAGTPAYSDARWSFERWEQATLGDAAELRLLFDHDRNVFYDKIARDPAYLAGWAGDPVATRSAFSELRRHADDRLRFARYAAYLLVLNHAVSAVDALRAARLHNLPLQERLQLRARVGARQGETDLAAALEVRF